MKLQDCHIFKTKTFSFGVILLLIFTLGSCKSHKKVEKDNQIYVGETVEVKNDKKESVKKENKLREEICKEAETWLGTPYMYGRQDKGVATDCSGLVYVVYQEIANIKLPRNSAKQADFCESIKEDAIQAGDLVFFATGKDKNKISHVGVMIDKKKFLHASSSKGVVISDITTPYYQRTFIKFGKVPGL